MDYIYAVIVLVGALIFIYPIIVYKRLLRLTMDPLFFLHWKLLLVFVAFFLGGYLFVVIDFIRPSNHYMNDAVLVSVMFFGSVFVSVSSFFFYRIIKYLDNIVKMRTEKLEKQHRETIKKDKELLKLKDQFLFVAAHELRAPITAMKWNLEMIYDREEKVLKTCDSEMAEMISDIKRNNEYLVKLVDDILDASRMEYGTFKLQNEKVDVCEICSDAVASIKPLSKQRDLTVNFDCPIDSIIIKTDPRRLKEVLINFLSNAIKYNVDGGKVELRLIDREGDLQFDIIDTGIGIKSEDTSKLFKKFSCLDTVISDDVKSTGLGLYICKQIVERMGGNVWIESEGLGHGSTFSFTIPKKTAKN